MAWIELHQAVWTHRKTFELAGILGIDETYAAAHVIRLWSWALDNAPSGAVRRTSGRTLAYGAAWRGDADDFIAALIASGWLDETPETLEIHDWSEYAGRLIDRREANATRKREARAARQNGTSGGHTPDVTQMSGATGPNRTLTGPDRTGPNPSLPLPPPSASRKAGAAASAAKKPEQSKWAGFKGRHGGNTVQTGAGDGR